MNKTDEFICTHIAYPKDKPLPPLNEIRDGLLRCVAEALIETRPDIQPKRRSPVLEADKYVCFEIRLSVKVP